MVAISAFLSMLCPCSSKYMASSAMYFSHGSLFPGATASKSSCVLREISSCVIARGEVSLQALQSNDVSPRIAAVFTRSLIPRDLSFRLTRPRDVLHAPRGRQVGQARPDH